MQTYSIAEVAEIFNITKYTIRHYVDAQLLTPTKNVGNGYYAFTDADLYRLYQVITFTPAIIRFFKGIKNAKSITIDHGREFAKYDEIEEKLGIPMYFARIHIHQKNVAVMKC